MNEVFDYTQGYPATAEPESPDRYPAKRVLKSYEMVSWLANRLHAIQSASLHEHVDNNLQDDGSIIIPADEVEKWRELAAGSYYMLPREEQEQLESVVKQHFSEILETEPTCFVDLCIDFDGVVHQYSKGWKGVEVVYDPPVDGAIPAMYKLLNNGFTLAIHSARSSQSGGIEAMRTWLKRWDVKYRREIVKLTHLPVKDLHPLLIDKITFPQNKPAAKMYLDDRAMRFDGPESWSKVAGVLTDFKPWNHKDG